jgi:Zn-dependent peptidase ImmA (M78 family)
MVKRFRTAASEASALTIDEIVETLLVESGVANTLPTNEFLLLDFLGLRQLSFDFMSDLDFLGDSHQVPRELRAALSLNDRIVAVQSNLGQKRGRFSTLHEVAHFILPEHRDRLFLDDDLTLSWWTRARLEREANKVAADLLFQGPRFIQEALDFPISCKTILELAPRYAASYEATLRRFTENHVLPCSVLVYDKVAKTSETDFTEDQYRLQYTITSEPFRKRFFAGLETNESAVSATELYNAKYWGQIVEQDLVVENSDKDSWRFQTEIFNNGYKIFQLVVGCPEP